MSKWRINKRDDLGLKGCSEAKMLLVNNDNIYNFFDY